MYVPRPDFRYADVFGIFLIKTHIIINSLNYNSPGIIELKRTRINRILKKELLFASIRQRLEDLQQVHLNIKM